MCEVDEEMQEDEDEKEEKEEKKAKEVVEQKGFAMQNLDEAGDLFGEEWCVVKVRFRVCGWVGQVDISLPF